MLRSNRLLRGKWLLRHHYGLRHHRAVAIEAVGERIAILDCFLNDAVFCAAAHVVHYKRDKHDEEDSAKDDGCDRGDEDFLMVGILLVNLSQSYFIFISAIIECSIGNGNGSIGSVNSVIYDSVVEAVVDFSGKFLELAHSDGYGVFAIDDNHAVAHHL